MASGSKKFLIGVDLGGTKVLSCVISSSFKICSREKVKVNKSKGSSNYYKSVVESIAGAIKKSGAKPSDLIAIGVGSAGLIDIKKGQIKLANNLPFSSDYPLKSKLSNKFKLPVYVENDVNAGLYGEFSLGAAKKAKNVVGLFVGTGIGGAIIIDGALYHGRNGAAGEMGDATITFDGSRFQGGSVRTLEDLAGRLTIAKEAAWLALKQQAPYMLKNTGTNLKNIKSGALLESIQNGDQKIRELITEKSHIIGVACANLANIFNPDTIVLGGGVIEALGRIMLPTIKKQVKSLTAPFVHNGLNIVEAELGDDATVLGAAKLAYQMKKQKG